MQLTDSTQQRIMIELYANKLFTEYIECLSAKFFSR
jgi:hypothetical protein